MKSGIFVLIVGCVVITQMFCGGRRKVRPDVWVSTIGTVTADVHNSWLMSYTASGKKYTSRVGRLAGYYVFNAKYRMRYVKDKPTVIKVDSWEPVFESGEETSFFIAKINAVHKENIFTPVSSIDYSYTVFDDNGDSLEIDTWCRLPVDYNTRYPDLAKGKFYNVQVWDENAYRAVLRLDLPIKYGKERPRDSLSDKYRQ